MRIFIRICGILCMFLGAGLFVLVGMFAGGLAASGGPGGSGSGVLVLSLMIGGIPMALGAFLIYLTVDKNQLDQLNTEE